MKRRIGRPTASACSLVFIPPLVRLIAPARWSSGPFYDRRPEAVRCALRQVASIITVFGTAASEAKLMHPPGKHPRASQTCRALVVTRGIEGADRATEEGPTMDERQIPHPVAAGIPESCLLYGFVHCCTGDGKVFRTLNIFDEFSRECLTIRAQRKLNSADVSDSLTDLCII